MALTFLLFLYLLNITGIFFWVEMAGILFKLVNKKIKLLKNTFYFLQIKTNFKKSKFHNKKFRGGYLPVTKNG